ncbi:MAG: DUF3131 domain-containing protein [Mariprofundaceae bacterium]|nr:DUF3131 domain-containing protein [Mariprofundaceae bacterium]
MDNHQSHAEEYALSHDNKAVKQESRRPWALIWGALFAFIIGLLLALLIIFWPAESSSPLNSGCGYFSNTDNERCQCLTTLHQEHPDFTRDDMHYARIAWLYFDQNYQPMTGLVNSVNAYPSTTMWDSGSVIFATLAARRLCLLNDNDFHQRMSNMLGTLNRIKLYDGVAPNKVYNTKTATMTDYNNHPAPKGIGVSTIDLARMISSLRTLSANYPEFSKQSEHVVQRWDFTPLVKHQQMYGLYRDPVMDETQSFQEGRLGYEQYAGKILNGLGLDTSVAANYNNKFRSDVIIHDIPIAVDSRDPRQYGAYNYVVTESYALEAMEIKSTKKFETLFQHIFDVQKAHAEKTGLVTAVSEDNLDREPYFLYNSIYVAGSPWSAITDTGVYHPELKTLSVKAAFSLAYLYPNDPYAKRLIAAIRNAYDPEKGWYSGVYESGLGYNKAITGNTNGIILETLIHKLDESLKLGSESHHFSPVIDRYSSTKL